MATPHPSSVHQDEPFNGAESPHHASGPTPKLYNVKHPTTRSMTRPPLPEKSPQPADYLHRQVYIIWLVLAYATMFCVAWVLLAWSSKRPFGRESYNCYGADGSCRYSSTMQAQQNHLTSRLIADAQTLLSAVSLLTIPLTSAVCAAGVVPWMQRCGRDMTIRQTITLADKGWTSPYVYWRLKSWSGWKRYGSPFVGVALLLNALGVALSPAITRLAATTAIKVPTESGLIVGVADVNSLLDVGYDLILPMRDSLKTAQPGDYQPRLWQHRMPNCTSTEPRNFPSLALDYRTDSCFVGGLTLDTLASAPEAWVSQLPSGFSTGVKTKQIVPRINSTAYVERVSELPSTCNDDNAALIINNSGQTWEYGTSEGDIKTADWWIKVCVPSYVLHSLDYGDSSPYVNTNDVQKIQETAYLDVYSMVLTENHFRATLRISINTTLGNFELPNYLNDNRPGPLLKHLNASYSPHTRRSNISFPSQHNETSNPTNLETINSPGPLLTMVYALFGSGSLPSLYSTMNATLNSETGNERGHYPCLDSVPLYNLGKSILELQNPFVSDCLRADIIRNGNQMHGFLYLFNQSTAGLEKVFRAAAYLYHDILFSQTSQGASGHILYDAGSDFQKPSLSDGAIIGLSLAIGCFLLCLLSLAIFASFLRTWTGSLDAYAMLRLGADLGSEAVPFVNVRDPHYIVELDELPGWVGNVGQGENVGQLGLGYGRHVKELDANMRFTAYPKELRRGKLRMFGYYLDGVLGCFGRRNSHAGAKLQRLREAFVQLFDGFIFRERSTST